MCSHHTVTGVGWAGTPVWQAPRWCVRPHAWHEVRATCLLRAHGSRNRDHSHLSTISSFYWWCCPLRIGDSDYMVTCSLWPVLSTQSAGLKVCHLSLLMVWLQTCGSRTLYVSRELVTDSIRYSCNGDVTSGWRLPGWRDLAACHCQCFWTLADEYSHPGIALSSQSSHLWLSSASWLATFS